MNNNERRQARRIVRHLKAVDCKLSLLMDELTGEYTTLAEPHDWESTQEQLCSIQGEFPLLFDLIGNIARETGKALPIVEIVLRHENGGRG